MASTCVKNMSMSSENFLDCPPAKKYQSYGWLSPRVSLSREFPDGGGGGGGGEDSKVVSSGVKPSNHEKKTTNGGSCSKGGELDPELVAKDMVDFEFRLEDPVNMLPADELFSDGKLVPLHLSMIRPAATTSSTMSAGFRSPDTPKLRIRNEISNTDPYLFSPKAPRCSSSRWREILGLKKLYQNSSNANKQQESHKTSSSSLPSSNAHKSLKNFLNRSSKSSLNSSVDSSLNLPLLKDSDSESVSISSRLSLSSSSSGHEHDDLPRLSLDSDKPTSTRNANQNANPNPPRVRVGKPRTLSSENPMATRVGRSPMRRQPADNTISTARGVSVDSPRMNSSGKIVFHSLERSSSSPSSFNGGPRYKHRGMERSYSANVRVTPVLNVPVCSLKSGVFGFPLFSSSSSSSSQQQRKDGSGNTYVTINGAGNKGQHSSRIRTDRIKE